MFNRELLRVFQARRLRDRKHKIPLNRSKKRKTVAFDDLNPPPCEDDEADLLALMFTPTNCTEV